MGKKIGVDPKLDDKIDTNIDVPAESENVKTEAVKASDYKVKTVDKPSVLKQQKVASVIAGGSAQGVPEGMGLDAAGNSVSGGSRAGLEGNQATTVGKDTRQDSRYGKKIERKVTKINQQPSEQYQHEFIESPAMGKANDIPQTYNGSYNTTNVRSQKSNGAVPAELNFDRSVDFIERDVIYYAAGQTFADAETVNSMYPKITANASDIVAGGEIGERGYHEIPCKLHHDDYYNRALKIKFDTTTKKLKEFVFVNDTVTPDYQAEVARLTSRNVKRAINQTELQRLVMESNSGNEVSDKWSPLSTAIPEPNAVLQLLKEYENSTGAEVALALHKLKTAMAFQCNKATKDGADPYTPAVEMLIGDVERLTHQGYYGKDVQGCLHGESAATLFKLGSPGLFIALQDSTAKYNTKADLLNQPRGWKMNIQTGLSNVGPLRVRKEFAKAMLNSEVYATPDGDYDPTKPIYMTNNAAIVHPFSFNRAGGIGFEERGTAAFKTTAVNKDTVIEMVGHVDSTTKATLNGNYAYIGDVEEGDDVYIHFDKSTGDIDLDAFVDSNGNVLIYATNFLNGISANKNFKLVIDTNASHTTLDDDLKIPAGHVYICVAQPACNGQVDWLEGLCLEGRYEPFRYQYSDKRNSYLVTVEMPLLKGIRDYLEDNAFKLTSSQLGIGDGEIIIPVRHGTRAITSWDLLIAASLPYILRARAKSYIDVFKYEQDFGYPFDELMPVKEVLDSSFANLGNVDMDSGMTIKAMTPAMKQDWFMGEFIWKVGTRVVSAKTGKNTDTTYNDFVMPWYISAGDYALDADTNTLYKKDDHYNFLFPSFRSGIMLEQAQGLVETGGYHNRLDHDIIVDISPLFKGLKVTGIGQYKYGVNADGQLQVSIEAESGKKADILKFMKCPRQYGFVMTAPTSAVSPRKCTPQSVVSLAAIDGVELWSRPGYTAYVYSVSGANIPTGILTADSVRMDRGINFVQTWRTIESSESALTAHDDGGVCIGMGQVMVEGVASGKSVLIPFTGANGITQNLSLNYLTNGFSYNYFRVNTIPFLLNPFDLVYQNGDASTVAVVGHDIYDLLYTFGCCGFRAECYDEEVYMNDEIVDASGFEYIADDRMTKSALFI